jgi:LacI family transcriptional regulator
MTQAAPKTSMADIARAADVSVATVSMALSNHPHISSDTKRLVLETSQRLGYQRRLGYKRTPKNGDDKTAAAGRYGFIIVGTGTHNAPDAAVLLHLSRAGITQGIRFECLGTPMDMPVQRVLEQIFQFANGLDGLILMNKIDRELCTRLREAYIPHIVLGHTIGGIHQAGGPLATTVAYDDVSMGYFATERLLRAGHTRIAVVCELQLLGLSHDRWVRGYKQALADAGVPFDPRLVRVTGQAESGAGPAVDPLLALKKPPTAYAIPDKRIAATLVEELRRRAIDVPAGSIVFHSHDVPPDSHPLARQTWLTGRADVLGDQAILQLRRVRRNPDAPGVEVLVPFDVSSD